MDHNIEEEFIKFMESEKGVLLDFYLGAFVNAIIDYEAETFADVNFDFRQMFVKDYLRRLMPLEIFITSLDKGEE